MPEGPLGIDRPFVTSNVVLRFPVDISGADVPDTPDERSQEIEQFIRGETGTLVDVKFGPANTFVLTRQQRVNWGMMVAIVNAITDYADRTGIRIVGDIQVAADGE